MRHFFIGVDGGATKCIVRVEDEAGNFLGQECSGPANIRLSVEQAWQSINTGLEKVLKPHAIRFNDSDDRFHAGMGLAGCEAAAAYQAFINHLSGKIFTTLLVESDAHTACLGAHGGKDGAVIIAGTGVVGYQMYRGEVHKVSGWGFPSDDQGGGAWIGLQAMTQLLQWLDGRVPVSSLVTVLYQHFRNDKTYLANWLDQANSTAYAGLAPMVIQLGQQGDTTAFEIMQQAAQAINKVGAALAAKGPLLPCVLVGGVASYLEPLLAPTLRSRLRSRLAEPEVGAAFLVREHFKKKGE